LNAGYLRGGQVIRTVGDDHEPRMFSCFAPVALAPIRKLPDTIEDRSISVTLRPPTKTENVTPLPFAPLQQLAPTAGPRQRSADDNRQAIEAADPAVPEALNDRMADCWRVLLAIADLSGGEWPQRARAAALALSRDNNSETIGTLLLGDIRDIFTAANATELS